MGTRRCGAIGLSLLLGCAGVVAGDVVNWVGGGDPGEWSDSNNWDSHPELPGASDRVIIKGEVSGYNVFINDSEDYTVDSIEIGEFDKLQIDDGTLTLENDDLNCEGGPSPACPARDNHRIDGVLFLSNDATLKLVNEEVHVLGGGGDLFGQLGGTAQISIGTDVTLTNQLSKMHGAMTITGVPFTTYPHERDGAFNNEGVVMASGPIVLAESTNVSDAIDAQWQVGGFCAGIYAGSIAFHREAVLDGDFEALETDDGERGACFLFFADVETFGAFIDSECSGVWVDTENEIEFCYWEYVDNGCGGGNPGMGEDPYCIDYVYCQLCDE